MPVRGHRASLLIGLVCQVGTAEQTSLGMLEVQQWPRRRTCQAERRRQTPGPANGNIVDKQEQGCASKWRSAGRTEHDSPAGMSNTTGLL